MKTRPFLMDFSRKALASALFSFWLCGVMTTQAAGTVTRAQASLPETHIAIITIIIVALLVGVTVSFSRRKSVYSHPEEDEL